MFYRKKPRWKKQPTPEATPKPKTPMAPLNPTDVLREMMRDHDIHDIREPGIENMRTAWSRGHRWLKLEQQLRRGVYKKRYHH